MLYRLRRSRSFFSFHFYKGVYSMREKNSGKTGSAAKAGIGFGACLAMVISWGVHKSVLLTILHGILGWLYVLYYVLTR
jgi:hypothetical protein